MPSNRDPVSTVQPGGGIEPDSQHVPVPASTQASRITVESPGTWADGTAVPGGGLQGVLAAIVYSLKVFGANLISAGNRPSWADGTINTVMTVQEALSKIIQDLTSTGGGRGAGKLTAPARANWADGTTNPPATVAEALTKIVTDLTSTTAGSKFGAGKLTAPALPNWADGTANPSTTIADALTNIVSALGTAAGGGSSKIYSAAITRPNFSTAAGTLRNVITAIVEGLSETIDYVGHVEETAVDVSKNVHSVLERYAFPEDVFSDTRLADALTYDKELNIVVGRPSFQVDVGLSSFTAADLFKKYVAVSDKLSSIVVVVSGSSARVSSDYVKFVIWADSPFPTFSAKPRVFAAPNGRMFLYGTANGGGSPQMVTTAGGAWTLVGLSPTNSGTNAGIRAVAHDVLGNNYLAVDGVGHLYRTSSASLTSWVGVTPAASGLAGGTNFQDLICADGRWAAISDLYVWTTTVANGASGWTKVGNGLGPILDGSKMTYFNGSFIIGLMSVGTLRVISMRDLSSIPTDRVQYDGALGFNFIQTAVGLYIVTDRAVIRVVGDPEVSANWEIVVDDLAWRKTPILLSPVPSLPVMGRPKLNLLVAMSSGNTVADMTYWV